MTDTLVFPEVFVPGFMGFATEYELMADFTATMRESGIRSYPRTYAELVAKQTRPMAEPKSFVPTVVKPSEGGDIPTGGNGNGAAYEGPKDLNYAEHAKKFGKLPGTRNGRGFVHAMTDAQIKFARFLLSTKDTSKMVMVKGWTLDPNALDTVSKQHARPFIDALLSCPDKANDSDKKELKGSPRQIEWITKGLNGKPSLLTEKGILTESDIKDFFTKYNYDAKRIIDTLLKMPRPIQPKSTKPSEEITEGMYTDGTRIIRAYMNREKTRILAKELIQEDDDYRFEYLGMAERFVKGMRRMTLDEAKAFGRMTETCCVCGTHLSDPDSQKKGIGPWCEKQF